MKQFQTLIIAFLLSINAYPHGENVPGPRGGFIRMPGPFHIELVPASKDRLQFFLLDMEFKNPIIEKSSVQAKWLRGGVTRNLICLTKKIHFECLVPKEISLKKGTQIEVQATRYEQKGLPVRYTYPFEHESTHEQVEEKDINKN